MHRICLGTTMLWTILFGQSTMALDQHKPGPPPNTVVDIVGENFLINGKLTYSDIPGCPKAMHGLLFNVRAVNATFDDLSSALPKGFLDDFGNRPDNNFANYGPWDPDANTDRFIAALPSWHANGVLAVTLNFQGGCSCSRNGENGAVVAGDNQTPDNNPYGDRGTPIHPEYLKRMKRAIDALDDNGMICILGLFYFGQDQRISTDNDSQAIKDAVDAVVDWVLHNKWRNVLIEINNETTVGAYQHDILQPDRVHELFQRVKRRSTRDDGTRLLVSASSTGKALPPEAWMREADFFLPHGNGLNAHQISRLVGDHRAHPAWKANPRPICFNEDSTSIDNLNAAAASHASWGLYNDAHHQSAWPANWQIWSPENIAFFSRVAELTGAGAWMETDRMVIVEAEHCTTTAPDATGNRAWYVQSDNSRTPTPDPDGFHPGAGGNAYVECLPDTRVTHDDPFAAGSFYNASPDGARLEYPILFQTTGTWYVWVRVFSTGTEDNGLHVGVDGRLADNGKRIQWCGSGWRWSNAQRDSGGSACGVNGTITLTIAEPGRHVITFYQREDGAELDRFIMTTDKTFNPTDLGIGPSESPCAIPGKGPTRLDDRSWTIPAVMLPKDQPDGNDRIWIPAATAASKTLEGAMSTSTQYAGDNTAPPDADPRTDSIVGQLLFADTDHDDGPDAATYTVDFPNNGTWYAWGRFYYPGQPGSNDPNCFWISIDNGPEYKFGNNRYGQPSYQQWHWDGNGEMEIGAKFLRLGQFKKGRHQLRIRNREADPKIGPRLDVILLTNNSRYIPTDSHARQSIQPQTHTP